MPEQELLGIDQNPAEIFHGGPEIGAGLEVLVAAASSAAVGVRLRATR